MWRLMGNPAQVDLHPRFLGVPRACRLHRATLILIVGRRGAVARAWTLKVSAWAALVKALQKPGAGGGA